MNTTEQARYTAYKDLASAALKTHLADRMTFRWDSFLNDLQRSHPSQAALFAQYEREVKDSGDKLILDALGLDPRVESLGLFKFAGELDLTTLQAKAKKQRRAETLTRQNDVNRSHAGLAEPAPADDGRYSVEFCRLGAFDTFETPDGARWQRRDTGLQEMPPDGNAERLSDGFRRNFGRDEHIRRV